MSTLSNMAESRQESRWVSVPEAARTLKTTEGAVRKRIERGSLHHEKRSGGRVYVRVDSVESRTDTGETAGQRLVEQYEARIESLEHQLSEANTRDREHRRLLAAALERMPALESTPAPRGSPENATEDTPEGTTPETSQSLTARFRRWVRGE